MAFPLSRAALVRTVPFVAFMLLLALRGSLSPQSALGLDPRWIYGLTVLVVGGLLAWFWREYGELVTQTLPSPSELLLAVVVGVAVFVLWVNLDALWMRLGEPSAGFVPTDLQGRVLWPLVAVRWVGASLIVPVMEELFWRSFLMRWVQSPIFESVLPRNVGPRAVLIATFIFVLAHTLWLAATIAGLAYAALYIRTGKLWLAVIAHGVTNAALGAWVVATGNWQFW